MGDPKTQSRKRQEVIHTDNQSKHITQSKNKSEWAENKNREHGKPGYSAQKCSKTNTRLRKDWPKTQKALCSFTLCFQGLGADRFTVNAAHLYIWVWSALTRIWESNICRPSSKTSNNKPPVADKKEASRTPCGFPLK